MDSDEIKTPPFETHDLRKNLTKYLNSEFKGSKVGNYKFGVYAFFDYDGEPIYVGQTNEMLRTRIRRHLTNQRTDAVAMSVLDPFEVYEIEVWPLPQFDDLTKKKKPDEYKQACDHLDALEYAIFEKAIVESEFKAILNEKDPPTPKVGVPIPDSYRAKVVSDDVFKIRIHPDFRIARRALILARLAQVISERQVQTGLRRTLLTQAKRLQWLAQRRYDHASGNNEESNDEAEE
jgi:hypothetical protein